MKQAYILSAALLSIAPSVCLSAAPQLPTKPRLSNVREETGDFELVAFDKKTHTVGLANNVFYKAHVKEEAEKFKDWLLGDSIRVLKTTRSSVFVLVNLRTGQFLRVDITNWDK